VSAAVPPVAQSVVKWLKANGMPLGGLTGCDLRALRAAVQVVDLMSYSGLTPDLLAAFAACVREMQPSQQFLALNSVAHVLDWDDRERVWLGAGLPDLGAVPVCACSPEARR